MTQARIGLLLAGEVLPRWQIKLVHELSAFCKPVLLTPPRGSERPRPSSSWLYRLYRRADGARFGKPDDPLAPGRLDTSSLESTDLGRIGLQELDVILCLAREDEAAALAPCARHGSWVLSISGGDWPLWALGGDEPAVASVTLRAFAADGAETVLRRSFTGLDRLSAHRTLTVAYSRAARLALRQLQLLHDRRPEAPLPAPSPAPPSSGESARRLLRLARQAVRHRARRLVGADEWYVAYRRLETEAPSRGLFEFTPLRSPPDRYYADPFVTSHAGRHYVLFEDYRKRLEKGVISYVEIGEDGRASAPAIALELDSHLSYPFVFADRGRMYMVPETRARRSVELYRAVRFPERWELERVLLHDTAASDATLLRHDGRWWLWARRSIWS